MVAYEFHGYALEWWVQYSEEVREGKRRHIDTWLDLRREMRSKFVPTSNTRDLYNKFQRMYRGSKIIKEHYKDMQVAVLRANILKSNKETMTYFLHGLNRDIYNVVELYHYASMDDLLQRDPTPTVLNDGRVRMKRKNGLERTKVQRRGAFYPKVERKRKIIVHKQDMLVHKCSPDDVDLLMLRCLMNAHVGEDDDSQRENIFHLGYSVLGKLCSIIIYGGSCVNFASLRLVEKLNLPTLVYPKPYKLQWLNSRGEMEVTK
ncbi:hypothetical protein CR513_02997, partial [Mucuna pruriens]